MHSIQLFVPSWRASGSLQRNRMNLLTALDPSSIRSSSVQGASCDQLERFDLMTLISTWALVPGIPSVHI